MPYFDPHSSLGFQSNLTLKAFMHNLAHRLEGSCISPTQFRLMAHLVANGAQTQAQLCETLSITAPSAVKLIDRMERDGWVVRQPDTTDRRINRIVLTEQAKANWAQLSTHAHELIKQAYRGIDTAEIATAIRVLTQVRANLGAE